MTESVRILMDADLVDELECWYDTAPFGRDSEDQLVVRDDSKALEFVADVVEALRAQRSGSVDPLVSRAPHLEVVR